MIRFKRVRWKNILSYGDMWTEIELTSARLNLLIGKNGGGKSTFLDALTFVLFGKPFRKINIPQLVNSVNRKDLLVEVEFDVGPDQYKIIRGLRPEIFEVYHNGTLLNQDAKKRDYQRILEKQILRLNYKSFTQIVVLGAASFQPFMQLSAANRRVVIEDLLDISIFSTMNDVLRGYSTNAKQDLESQRSRVALLGEQMKQQRKFISSIAKDREAQIAENDEEITATIEKIAGLKARLILAEQDVQETEPLYADYQRMTKYLVESDSEIKSLEFELRKLNKSLSFYTDNDHCPTCKQAIEDSFKENKVGQLKIDARQMEGEIDRAIKRKETCTRNRAYVADAEANLIRAKQSMASLETEIKHQLAYIKKLRNASEKLTQTSDISTEAEQKLEELQKSSHEAEAAIKNLMTKIAYFEAMSKLLADDGVKGHIIKTYIPLINNLINQYLSEMECYISFTLDENFEETVRSRFRDTFSYASFSEGEKLRIDLALLFTWREISSIKNSTNTNLIVMDEITDRSMDVAGRNDFIRLLQSLDPSVSSFVISHNDKIRDQFDRIILASKEGNYSHLSVIQ
jgi:DNA repair exonuclease SbcCD ATPase subunit